MDTFLSCLIRVKSPLGSSPPVTGVQHRTQAWYGPRLNAKSCRYCRAGLIGECRQRHTMQRRMVVNGWLGTSEAANYLVTKNLLHIPAYPGMKPMAAVMSVALYCGLMYTSYCCSWLVSSALGAVPEGVRGVESCSVVALAHHVRGGHLQRLHRCITAGAVDAYESIAAWQAPVTGMSASLAIKMAPLIARYARC